MWTYFFSYIFIRFYGPVIRVVDPKDSFLKLAFTLCKGGEAKRVGFRGSADISNWSISGYFYWTEIQFWRSCENTPRDCCEINHSSWTEFDTVREHAQSGPPRLEVRLKSAWASSLMSFLNISDRKETRAKYFDCDFACRDSLSFCKLLF